MIYIPDPDPEEYEPGDCVRTEAEKLAELRRWWPNPPAQGDADTEPLPIEVPR